MSFNKRIGDREFRGLDELPTTHSNAAVLLGFGEFAVPHESPVVDQSGAHTAAVPENEATENCPLILFHVSRLISGTTPIQQIAS